VTDRATGRHRAPARATTPLSTLGLQLTSAMSGHVTGISRTGAVLAVSSGLVASIGLPAGAVTRDAPNTATIPRSARAANAADPALQAVPSSFVSGAPLSAPAGASPTFDQSSFTAVPKPKAPPPAPVSRSANRTALRSTGTTTGSTTSTPTFTGGGFGSARGSSVIAVAARYLGVPYRYGGTTPSGFDCSGYTQYVFAQLGISIPRTADQQYNAVTRIPSSQAQAGDLVFFLGSGGAYHVGIYAGGGMMYDSGRPGEVITKRAIWSADIAFGRA
jgi:cell wall-associated NlpC family hydrolase